MSDSTQRNINRSKVHEPMVQQLSSDKVGSNERTIFPTIKSLMCFSALLGIQEGRYTEIDRSKGVDDIAYTTFETDDSDTIIYLVALAHAKDISILKTGREAECITLFEGYANGGLEIVADFLRRTSVEYPDKAILSMLKSMKYLEDARPEPDLGNVSF